jgi:hypothetical protein
MEIYEVKKIQRIRNKEKVKKYYIIEEIFKRLEYLRV